MSLVEQYWCIKADSPLWIVRNQLESVARQHRRTRARCAETIFDIEPGSSGRCNEWISHLYGDEHVPRSGVDISTERALLVLNSGSSEPSVTATVNCTAHELIAWDSPSPANFGGDGHSWWKAYYIVPTDSFVDFDASGSAQYMNWYMSLHSLIQDTGLGTYADGVDLSWKQGLFYGGSGVLTNETQNALSSQIGDIVQLFGDFKYRTFDDLDQYFIFNQDGDFNRDQHRFNADIPPIDWHLADQVDDGGSHTVHVGTKIVVTPGGFPGAARALATFFAARLHAICPADVGAPQVTTEDATGIGPTEATLHGTVVTDGGNALSERGFVIGPFSGNPPVKGMSGTNTFINGTTTVGAMSQHVGGADPSTLYIYRAYATNAMGTVYGDVGLFSTT